MTTNEVTGLRDSNWNPKVLEDSGVAFQKFVDDVMTGKLNNQCYDYKGGLVLPSRATFTGRLLFTGPPYPAPNEFAIRIDPDVIDLEKMYPEEMRNIKRAMFLHNDLLTNYYGKPIGKFEFKDARLTHEITSADKLWLLDLIDTSKYEIVKHGTEFRGRFCDTPQSYSFDFFIHLKSRKGRGKHGSSR